MLVGDATRSRFPRQGPLQVLRRAGSDQPPFDPHREGAPSSGQNRHVSHPGAKGRRREEAAVKPWEVLGRARMPDGTELTLTRHPSEYVILADGESLMSSRMHGSEEALAVLGCRQARLREKPCVLIGGLGMGFTLRAALDILPASARVVVAELVPAVVQWNRGPLGPLANHPLDDGRVSIEEGDVGAIIGASPDRFDALLLDVDNGPAPFTSASNVRLYDERGIAAARAALRPCGVLAVWSVNNDRGGFERRLRAGGFRVQREAVRARGGKKTGPRHTIFVAQRTDSPDECA